MSTYRQRARPKKSLQLVVNYTVLSKTRTQKASPPPCPPPKSLILMN